VARELGFTDSLIRLCEPFNAYEYGCAKLAECLKRFPAVPSAVAAYNAGTPRITADGKSFVNQQYVDSVLGYYSNLVR
jgi:soluble lytic murein transglycosylase-like protein